MRDDKCGEIMKDCWRSFDFREVGNLKLKLDVCKERLSEWGNDMSQNFNKRINDCKK